MLYNVFIKGFIFVYKKLKILKIENTTGNYIIQQMFS